jgi:hypothetical protein
MRLPAYGREIALLLRAGRRPIGGSIVVTTQWELCRDCARVVCPPDVPAENFDFSFLRGQEVMVVVPAAHEEFGHRLLIAVRRATPKLAILLVAHDAKREAA